MLARIGSVDMAIKTARTAAWFRVETKSLTPLVGPGESLYQTEQRNGELITFSGGSVLKNGEEIIGAFGVSGDTVDNDHATAGAGASAR